MNVKQNQLWTSSRQIPSVLKKSTKVVKKHQGLTQQLSQANLSNRQNQFTDSQISQDIIKDIDFDAVDNNINLINSAGFQRMDKVFIPSQIQENILKDALIISQQCNQFKFSDKKKELVDEQYFNLASQVINEQRSRQQSQDLHKSKSKPLTNPLLGGLVPQTTKFSQISSIRKGNQAKETKQGQQLFSQVVVAQNQFLQGQANTNIPQTIGYNQQNNISDRQNYHQTKSIKQQKQGAQSVVRTIISKSSLDNIYGKQDQGLQQNIYKKQSFLSILQPTEKEKFGDRCPTGFRKLDILGRGGIALVWLAEPINCEAYQQKKVALKQFPKIKNGQMLENSAKIEIEVGNTLFPLMLKDGRDGAADSDYERGYAVSYQESPGIRSIARLIDQIDDKNDLWLVYEVGANCLTKHLSEVKGEFYKGERIYRVQHQGFYELLFHQKRVLRQFVTKIAEAFEVLSKFGIVHCDIKPDNILIEFNGKDIQNIKIIDFGSAFQFHNVTQISATTPEYLAPEILEYLEQRSLNSKSNYSAAASLNQRCPPWSFDVWSLGIILLEIATGFPVWMSLKCRVSTIDGKSVLGSGLLGVQGREGKRILAKQQQILKNIPQLLRKYECYGLDRDPLFIDLIEKILCTDPAKRISPIDIIKHPFCIAAN